MFDGRRGLRRSSGGASSASLLAPLVQEFRSANRGGVIDREVSGGSAEGGAHSAAAEGRVKVDLVTMPAAKLAASWGLPPPLDEVGVVFFSLVRRSSAPLFFDTIFSSAPDF